MGLRNCSFEPAKHMEPIEFQNSGKVQLYLPVKDRVDWFNQYCAEHQLVGVIDAGEAEFIPFGNKVLMKVTASVLIDGATIARTTSGAIIDINDIDATQKIQWASTAAIGRALSYAGFGSEAPTEAENALPVDSGVDFTNSKEEPAPVESKKRGRPRKEDVQKETPKTEKVVDSMNPDFEGLTIDDISLEKAKQYKVPVGKEAGTPIWRFLAEESLKKRLAYYAANDFQNKDYPLLKPIARKVCDAAGIMYHL